MDLIFHAHDQELANLEFKVAGASQLDIEIQNRKNIRLNRAIMESQHAAYRVKSTLLFFDFQGNNRMFKVSENVNNNFYVFLY